MLALDGESVHRIGGKDLCDLLALSSGALTDLKKRGIAVHLGHDAYDLKATVQAYVQHLRGIASGRGGEEHTVQLSAERARLAKEQADAQALKNAKARAELVDASEVEHRWADVLRKVRARILSAPPRLRQVLNLDAESAEVIDRELRDALSELGNADD
ncbi:DNA packaging protein [uncultured Salipiger sp.]|jgi:terminase small subunit / prophage DNA-packing protein|uniref:DNA packaging protein n=1 Tax=uncultured Salipiger sp. TaxID=499810 RepID=UPI00259A9227|nr:DNA packaging protein [uncultured Salipiger sp.]